MVLFEVKGWNLKQDKVAVEGKVSKKSKKKRDKNAKAIQNAMSDESKSEKDVKRDEKKIEEEKDEIAGSTDPTERKSKPKKTKKRTHEETEGARAADASKEIEPEKKTVTKAKKEEEKDLPLSTQKLTPLQQKMMAKLSGSRFRWINEQLYTTNSEKALQLMTEQPTLFDEYHKGFKSQVNSWPENPVDVFVDQIRQRATSRVINAPGGLPGLANKQVVIADMGCGEAQLALDVNDFVKSYNQNAPKKFQKAGNSKRSQKPAQKLDIRVHSFDLKKANDRITVADIKNVPLPDGSCTIVVFCLALMGTNFLDFIEEAYRLLAPRGELWIAEIKSRFTESAEQKARQEEVGAEFVEALKLSGFFHKNTDNSNKMFSRFEFFKPPQDIIAERQAKLERRKKFIEKESEKEEFESRRSKNPEGEWLLKPCIYKRR